MLITYNGYTNLNILSDELILCTFDYGEDIDLGLTRTLEKNEVHGRKKITNVLGTKYSDTLVFKFTMCKSGCNSTENIYFNDNEMNTLIEWLQSSESAKYLKVTNDQDEDYFYYGVFTLLEATSFNGLCAISCEFTCLSPYGYSDEINKDIILGGSINIQINTDSPNEYIYPLITINSTEVDCETSITNMSDDNNTMTMNIPHLAPVYFDCKNCIAYDANGGINFTVLNWTPNNLSWLRLKDGDNNITTTGSGTATLTYREVRKLTYGI